MFGDRQEDLADFEVKVHKVLVLYQSACQSVGLMIFHLS